MNNKYISVKFAIAVLLSCCCQKYVYCETYNKDAAEVSLVSVGNSDKGALIELVCIFPSVGEKHSGGAIVEVVRKVATDGVAREVVLQFEVKEGERKTIGFGCLASDPQKGPTTTYAIRAVKGLRTS